MTKISDLLQTQEIVRDQNGFTATRSYYVELPGGSRQASLYNALLDSSIPQYGEPHPVLEGLQVIKVSAKPKSSGNAAIVDVRYGVPSIEGSDELDSGGLGQPTVSVNSGTASQETFFDINGDPLEVVWQSASKRITFLTPGEVQRPRLSVVFRRTETNMPKAAIREFLGKVNSVQWSGFPPKTWLCTGIDARENRGKFDVQYSFAYREEDWRLELIPFLDPDQVKDQPPDRDTRNGYAVYDVYHAANFNSLGLQF